MHPTTAELFTDSLEKTGVWLEELAQDLGNTTRSAPTPCCAQYCMPCATG